METNFIKDLITKAQLESLVITENGGKNIIIKFERELGQTENQEKRLFMAELFEEIFHRKLKIKTFSFNLKNKEGSEFIFDLNNLDTNLACVTKIGTLSLYLSKEDILRLQKNSGQMDNSAHKVATFAFDPQNLRELNYTIFYTRNLTACIIENPSHDHL